jgi:hypothetical protein
MVFVTMSNEVPRPGADEAGCRQRLRVAGEERVAGDLLANESRIEFILVEGADDPVAVRPGKIATLVLVVAVRVAVVNDVQPVPAPAFAVARRGQQAVDELGVGVGAVVAQEGRDLVGGRRQSVQVEGESAQQR